jgi:hypothetical protein
MITLFRSKSETAVQKLQAVLQENAADTAWRESFGGEIRATHKAAHDAADAFRADPNPETANALADANEAHARATARYTGMSDWAVAAVHARCGVRLRAVLADSIKGKIDEFEAGLDRAIDLNAETARQLGCEPGEVQSPMIQRLREQLNAGHTHLGKLASASWDELQPMVEYCLGGKPPEVVKSTVQARVIPLSSSQGVIRE